MKATKFTIVFVFLFCTTPAYAYLDPGTGSLFLQLLLGGVAGLIVIIKLYWHSFLVKIGLRKETILEHDTDQD